MSLREIAARCNFARCCDKCESLQLRDRIVAGLRCEDTIEKLLSFGSSLSLEVAQDLCEAAESSKQQSSAIAGHPSVSVLKKSSAYKVRQKTQRTSPGMNTVPRRECKFCGRVHEMRKELCPAFGKKCEKCKRKNHFAAKCTSQEKFVPKNSSRRQLGCLLSSMDSSSHLVEATIQRPDIHTTLQFLPDTGAEINAIPRRLLSDLKIDENNLVPSSLAQLLPMVPCYKCMDLLMRT